MKKLIGFVTCLSLALLTAIPAFAGETPQADPTDQASYVAIINKVNAECGTQFRFPTEADLETAGFESGIDLENQTSESLILFENQLREAAALNQSFTSDPEMCGSARNGARNIPETPKTLRKEITGGLAEFQGFYDDSKGYLAWTRFIDTDVTANTDGDYSFILDSYTRSFMDAYRTCKVTYKGDLYKNTIVGWIPERNEQVVFWYASSSEFDW